MNTITPDSQNVAVATEDARIAAYGEICKSYHAIDDFRMKLLGLLPFTSLAAILLVNKDALLSSLPRQGSELFGFAAVFASAFTLTLFVYEVRGILRSDGLIKRGKDIEDQLGVHGQFWQCDYEAAAENKLRPDCPALPSYSTRLSLPAWCTPSCSQPGCFWRFAMATGSNSLVVPRRRLSSERSLEPALTR